MQSGNNSKNVLITGGSRGIGKAIAICLCEASVADTFFINYLENDVAAEIIRAELKEKGKVAYLLKYNLAIPGQIQEMFAHIGGLTDHLDFFVHCTALTTFKPIHKVKPNQWDLTMNVATRSFLQCAQGCIPLMGKGGKIVAISSTGSQRFNANYGALGVAKSALESLVRYLAVELADMQIQVNGVTLGLIQGETMPLFPDIAAVIEETLQRTPANRLGTPADAAKVVLFLLTQADWMYGQNIILDGGFCLT
jgi:enoyl-[acyl-carrier protein] reductase III